MTTIKYDAIIIGAGLGGLTAGAKLAKEGKKVLIIEQHYVQGGFATTFKHKDFTVEVSLHEMAGFTKYDSKINIFKDLGILDNVELLKVPEFYRFVRSNAGRKIDIVIPFDYKKAIDILVEHFPNEEKGIKKFFKFIINIHKGLQKLPKEKWKLYALLPIFPILYPGILFYRNKTVGKYLDSIIKDDDLKLVLLANLAYYHDDPYALSLLYFAAAQGTYFSGGGYYIKGGSQKLSDHLAGVIKKNGGEIILGQLVTEIITKEDKAIGVKYRKTFRDEAEIKEVFGNYIIANAAMPNVGNELLSSSKAVNKLRSEIKKQEIACSLTSVYLGFKKPVKELGNNHYSTFVFDESVSNQSDFIKNAKGDFSKRSFVFVDYGQIDSQLAPEGKSVGAICIIDYLSDWEKLSSEEYKAKKEKVAQILIEKLNKLIPGTKEAIEYYEVGTPKTLKRYTLNPEGAVYGFTQIPKQAGIKRMKQKSPIKNLYFASAWTVPGGGFTGAILSGYWCAEKIL